MAEILVLALGNPLRGDDGIGARAAQHLADFADGEALKVVTCQQLTPELAELVAGARRVIFVDAAVDAPPGEVRCHPVQSSPHSLGGFSHHFTPPLLLGYSKSLFNKCPEAFQVSIGGGSFDYSESLSQEAQAGYPELIRTIEDLCRVLQGPPRPGGSPGVRGA